MAMCDETTLFTQHGVLYIILPYIHHTFSTDTSWRQIRNRPVALKPDDIPKLLFRQVVVVVTNWSEHPGSRIISFCLFWLSSSVSLISFNCCWYRSFRIFLISFFTSLVASSCSLILGSCFMTWSTKFFVTFLDDSYPWVDILHIFVNTKAPKSYRKG